MNKSVLFISNVWPEANSTAAGRRTLGLIKSYLDRDYSVHFFATCKLRNSYSEELDELGVLTKLIELNDSKFDSLITEMKPNHVIFDRFMMEEQFGWRVKDFSPDSIRILDTQDLHFLRVQREEEFKKKKKRKSTEIKLRELASIFRSDLSLIISKVELELLLNIGVPDHIIHHYPFAVDLPDQSLWKPFEERKDFVTIGSFLHEPNVDSIMFLKRDIWPLIRKKLPKAKLHVYGAYCQKKYLEMTNEKEGFLVHGFAKDALEVISNARVLIAPLRFGAGQKGKLLECFLTGTPSVTTPIGAEGMIHDYTSWPGAVCTEINSIVEECVRIHQDDSLWSDYSGRCAEVIDSQFYIGYFVDEFFEIVNSVNIDLQSRREQNIIGEMLNFHTMRSTKFMSQWIEAKNKLTN